MEKIDLLIWDETAVAAAADLEGPGIRSVELASAADLSGATLLMGSGADLRGLAAIWVDSVDVWPEIARQVPGTPTW